MDDMNKAIDAARNSFSIYSAAPWGFLLCEMRENGPMTLSFSSG